MINIVILEKIYVVKYEDLYRTASPRKRALFKE